MSDAGLDAAAKRERGKPSGNPRPPLTVGPKIFTTERIDRIADITGDWKILGMKPIDGNADTWQYFGEIAANIRLRLGLLRDLHQPKFVSKYSGVTGTQLTHVGERVCLYVRIRS